MKREDWDNIKTSIAWTLLIIAVVEAWVIWRLFIGKC